MVSYRNMTQEEFMDYRAYSNEFRGQELADAKHVSHIEGVLLANTELDECLPLGLQTENNILLCLEVEFNGITYVIGYFWYLLSESSAFIYDFQILPEYQGNGYGRQVFQALNYWLHTIMSVHSSSIKNLVSKRQVLIWLNERKTNKAIKVMHYTRQFWFEVRWAWLVQRGTPYCGRYKTKEVSWKSL